MMKTTGLIVYIWINQSTSCKLIITQIIGIESYVQRAGRGLNSAGSDCRPAEDSNEHSNETWQEKEFCA
jgi:hypothetical protein